MYRFLGLLLLPGSGLTAAGPTIGKCPVFPADNVRNTPVDGLPLDAHSAAYFKSIGADKTLHSDFARDANRGSGCESEMESVSAGIKRPQFHWSCSWRVRRPTL